MALFQKSVLKRHLDTLDTEKLEQAWQKFTNYFHNPGIQQNIREAKEEQFQEGFLRELFVNVLGYRLNPMPDYNLTTEYRNETGSKKADGAVLRDGKAIAVIELKGTGTTDLDRINDQAFSYKNNQADCVYVITSNFEKLRFFIHNSVEHMEFNLFALGEEEFNLLWLCLGAESLFKDTPLKIKEQSLLEEEDVTKQLYRDYSAFKTELWQNMVKNIPGSDQLLLFKRAQKLLDRFLFIFFAEDMGLLPPNSISRIVRRWEILKEEDAYKPLYEIFNQYFGYINTGRKGKKTIDDIFAYNGGLFHPDEILDSAVIDDDALHPHVMKLTNYDFQSEVDVNILGHIFENSLSEIENITARLEGKEIDKGKTRRRKDGVYYTPKYITGYIVENTVGRLCGEKKEALGIIDEEYARGRKHRKKETIIELEERLKAYRSWLLNITICDPACGSGAFLNQALEFLINEHGYIDELRAQLFGDAIVFQDVSNEILEKNIYGVDINEESVEIAKLSLWLRTAKRGRQLTFLNENIKCGNSLIDDPQVAGDKAFDWEREFPEVFANGGFDVVIGNPPYVRQELLKPYKDYFSQRYQSYAGTADLYTYFIEKGVDELINENGIYSIIVANKWMLARYGTPLRKWMKEKGIMEIIDFGDLPVFEDATTYPSIITLRQKSENKLFNACKPETLAANDLQQYVSSNHFQVDMHHLDDQGWSLVSAEVSRLLLKLRSKGVPLGEYTNGKVFYGIKTGFNEAFVIDKEERDRLIREDPESAEVIKPFLAGRDIKRYSIDFKDRYLIFTRRGINIDAYPAIKKHLTNFKERLEPKPEGWTGSWNGRKPGSYKWYEIQDSIDYYEEFEKPKIIYPNICKKPEFSYDVKNYFTNQKCFIIPKDDKYLLGILNSSVINFLFAMILPKLRGDFYEPSYTYLKNFPIASANNNSSISNKVVQQVKAQLDLHVEFDKVVINFTNLILTKFNLDKISNMLESWHELEFGDFLKELKKKKIKLSLSEEAEWMEYFNEQKSKALELKTEIDKTDREIDQMVYELYELTPEEIRIVEEGV